MPVANRILDPEPVPSLRRVPAERRRQGARRRTRARSAGDDRRSDRPPGIRGRGGAGFPTGVKWRTVAANASAGGALDGGRERGRRRARLVQGPRAPRSQPVPRARRRAHRGARGRRRPGDRRDEAHRDPPHRARPRPRSPRCRRRTWPPASSCEVVEGPPEYLLGEETALLEAIDGRYPFPRIAPPYRRGVDEMVETEADLTSESGLSAHVEMAGRRRRHRRAADARRQRRDAGARRRSRSPRAPTGSARSAPTSRREPWCAR